MLRRYDRHLRDQVAAAAEREVQVSPTSWSTKH